MINPVTKGSFGSLKRHLYETILAMLVKSFFSQSFKVNFNTSNQMNAQQLNGWKSMASESTAFKNESSNDILRHDLKVTKPTWCHSCLFLNHSYKVQLKLLHCLLFPNLILFCWELNLFLTVCLALPKANEIPFISKGPEPYSLVVHSAACF